MTNVRVLNGATMGNGAAAQITGPVRSVNFDWCDFMGNVATDGGAGTAGAAPARLRPRLQVLGVCSTAAFPPCPRPAVNVLGASNVVFTNCNLGVNFADNMGGAVKTVGSNVTFSNTAFYQNRAATGGAIGMGPMSHIVLINSNFRCGRLRAAAAACA